MENLEKALLLFGIILLVIGISMIIEGQILGEMTILASIVLTLTGMTLILMRARKHFV
jgi:hypothetical protein